MSQHRRGGFASHRGFLGIKKIPFRMVGKNITSMAWKKNDGLKFKGDIFSQNPGVMLVV